MRLEKGLSEAFAFANSTAHNSALQTQQLTTVHNSSQLFKTIPNSSQQLTTVRNSSEQARKQKEA